MKSKHSIRTGQFSIARLLGLGLGLAAAGLLAPRAHAASASWLGTTSGLWSDDTNWTAAHPVSGDTATFNAASSNTVIDLGTGQAAATVLFDTANAASYTIGTSGQTLTLDTTGAVTLNATVTTSQLFNANLVLGTAGNGAAVGTTTITNNAAVGGASLTFAGTVTGGTGGTAGIKTLNTAGTGAVNFTNALSAGGGTLLNVANISTGTTTLSGNVTSTLSTLRATAGGTMQVNGQNVTVAASSAYGGTTAFGKFILTSGSAAFNGGIQSGTSSGSLAGADGMAFIVNGGTFTASTVALGRSGALAGTTSGATISTAGNIGSAGFQVNGGTATVTGAVRIAGSNGAADGQVSGTGNLTVNGEFTLGEGTASLNSTRTNVFQVTGGTLTNTDTAGNGINIGRGTTAVAASGELLLTGGTTTANKVSFGLNGGLAGSFGNLTMNGAAANLYVGSGGIVLNATNAYTLSINLTAGTIGATAAWTSPLNMALNGAAGTSFTFQAADATAAAQNITLTGVLSGTGGLAKTGAGILTLTSANTYGGGTTVNAGTLAVSGAGSFGTGNITLANAGGVVLTLGNTAAIADSATLIFGPNSQVQLNAAGSETLTAITNSATNATLNSGTYTAAQLNSFFGVTSFSGTETVTFVPEPGTWAFMAGGLAGLAALARRRQRCA